MAAAYLLSLFQTKRLPLIILISVILFIVMGEILDSHFECPIPIVLKGIYISLYFIFPSLALAVLWYTCQIYFLNLPGKRCPEICCALLWSVFFALFWVVILLLDGKHLACACSPVEGNVTTQIAQTCSVIKTWSKIAGLVLFLVIFFINACCVSRYYEKMEQVASLKWEGEGTASCVSPQGDLKSENKDKISFHFVVNKHHLSCSTGDKKTKEPSSPSSQHLQR